MIFYKLSLAKSLEVIPSNDFLFCVFAGRGTAQKSQPETYNEGRYMYKYTNICYLDTFARIVPKRYKNYYLHLTIDINELSKNWKPWSFSFANLILNYLKLQIEEEAKTLNKVELKVCIFFFPWIVRNW